MSTYGRYITSARTTFGTPANRAVLWSVIPAADILLVLALIGPKSIRPELDYILLAAILGTVFRLAWIVCDPRQPRRPGPSGGDGDGWGGNPPWPPGYAIILLLIAATIGIILTYTGLYWYYGMPGWQESMQLTIQTAATVNGPTHGTPSFLWVGATQELVDLAFFSGLVTIALGRIR